MTAIAVIGHLTRDVVASGAPRPGGGVFYATRSLARLGVTANVAASCAAGDRPELLPPLQAFGLPVTWHESTVTTSYSFHYEGDRRIMWQEAVGDPWTADQALTSAGDAAWVDVCALVRSDFSAETLAALANGGRKLLIDAQGLVRVAKIGPLLTDGDIGDVLRHIQILKLNDEEADTLVGSSDPDGLRGLGVPEVILTLGSLGSWVVTPGLAEHVAAIELEGPVDPTGAGDTYSVTYLTQRVAGAGPVEAARVAAATVAELLVGT